MQFDAFILLKLVFNKKMLTFQLIVLSFSFRAALNLSSSSCLFSTFSRLCSLVITLQNSSVGFWFHTILLDFYFTGYFRIIPFDFGHLFILSIDSLKF